MALVVLLGGARSGKSTLAVELAAATGRAVTFIATAEARDEEMCARIDLHRAERPPAWTTVEEPVELEAAIATAPAEAAVVVDCLSLWVANLVERMVDPGAVEARARDAAGAAARRAAPTFAVTNEVGLGIVPANDLARAYRDLLGRVNATWCGAAEEAVLVVAGRFLSLAPPAELHGRLA